MERDHYTIIFSMVPLCSGSAQKGILRSLPRSYLATKAVQNMVSDLKEVGVAKREENVEK